MILQLPYSASSRLAAIKLLEQVSDSDTLKEAVVDFSALKLSSQGFIDELCVQLLAVRGFKRLVFKGASTRVKEWAIRSVKLRGLESLEFQDS